jgi:hypothetical protein
MGLLRRGFGLAFSLYSPGIYWFMELISCDDVLNKNEVWYDIKTIRQPTGRKSKLIPPEKKLNAIRFEE